MGRRKTVRELQRDLQYAQKRESYVAPDRPEGGAPRRQPKSPYKYESFLAVQEFTIQASAQAVSEFGGIAALGLAEAGDDPGAPRGFKPNMIHMVLGDTTPTYVKSPVSGRTYIRYGKGTRESNTQYTFAAPISAATPTPASVKTKFETVSNAMKSKVGQYGRIWIEWERLPLVESGVAVG